MSCPALSGYSGANTRHRPRTTHQSATAIGSFDPKGNGASAVAANNSHEAILARTTATLTLCVTLA